MHRLPLYLALCLPLIPIWAVEYLPMSDLPVHGAQIATWLNLSTHFDELDRIFSVNWLTPYLGGYLVAFALSTIFSVPIALKIVLSAAIVGMLVATAHLLDEARAPRIAVIALVPIAFNQTFYWGMLNHLVAIPFALLLIARAYTYARAPSRRNAALLMALGVALLLCHVIVLAIACAVAVLVLWVERAPVTRAWPLACAWPPAIAWMWLARTTQAQVVDPTDWRLGWHRFSDLAQDAFGLWGAPAPVRLVAALALVAVVVVGTGTRLKSARHLLLPLLPIAIYLAAPYRVFGTGCLNARAAIFVLPLLACALESRAASARRNWFAFAPSLFSLAALTQRFRHIDVIARTFDPILRKMEPSLSALALIYRPVEALVQSPIYEHFVDWYALEKGGRVDPSAAATKYQMMMRYRAGVSRVPSEWSPRELDLAIHGDYDYYVVRAPAHHPGQIFGRFAPRMELLLASGDWWLYQWRSAAPPGLMP